MKVANELINAMLDGSVPPDLTDKEGDKTFVKYDRIVINSNRVTFMAGKLPLMYIDHTAEFGRGDTLTLDLMRGLIEFELVNN